MSYDMDLGFPGGKKVDAHFNGFTVQTDQEVKYGGEGSAPQPFDLFFASIATCCGYYALQFCLSRELNTDGLKVRLTAEKNEKKKLFDEIILFLTLPEGFPQKYRDAIVRAVNLCTVKRHLHTELHFDIKVTG